MFDDFEVINVFEDHYFLNELSKRNKLPSSFIFFFYSISLLSDPFFFFLF